MTFSKLIIKNFKHDVKQYNFLYIAGAMIGSLLMLYLYIYFLTSELAQKGLFPGNIQLLFLFLSCFVVVIGILFFRFLLTNYIKNRMKDYEIYISLGIPKKKLILCIFLEFASVFAFMILLGAILSLIWTEIFRFLFSIKQMNLNNQAEFILAFGMYFVFMIIIFMTSIFLFYIGTKRYGIEKYLRAIIKKNVLKQSRIGQFASFILGILLQCICIILWIHFSVLHMLMAIALHLIGVYFLMDSWVFVRNKILHRKKDTYYKHVVSWRFFSSEFKENKKIIYILYMSHFFVTFVILAICISALDSQKEDLKNHYPYETILIGNQKTMNTLSHKNALLDTNSSKYSIFLLKINGKDVYTISNSTYEKLSHKNLGLKSNQMAYIEQVEEAQVTDRQTQVFVEGELKNHSFQVIRNKSTIVFGEDLALCVRNLYVCSDEDSLVFEKSNPTFQLLVSSTKLKRSNLENYKNIVWEKNKQNQSTSAIKLKSNEFLYFDGAGLKVAYQMENKFVLLSTWSIGVLLLCISFLVLFVKELNNLESKKEDYKILQQLGMPLTQIKKVFSRQIFFCFYLPVYLATVFGAVFFAMDLHFESKSYMTEAISYIGMLLGIVAIQVCCEKLTFHQLWKRLYRG